MTSQTIAPGATSDRILDVAEALAQTRGFNGFSYADIATEVGVRKASLHYHFPTKADLGVALISRYTDRFMGALEDIESSDMAPLVELERYVEIYEAVLLRDRMCLCGMLVAEYNTLPSAMQEGIRQFFDRNEAWLVRVLDDGASDGTLAVRGTTSEVARMITGSLEGSMMLAYSYGDTSRFTTSSRHLIAGLAAEPV